MGNSPSPPPPPPPGQRFRVGDVEMVFDGKGFFKHMPRIVAPKTLYRCTIHPDVNDEHETYCWKCDQEEQLADLQWQREQQRLETEELTRQLEEDMRKARTAADAARRGATHVQSIQEALEKTKAHVEKFIEDTAKSVESCELHGKVLAEVVPEFEKHLKARMEEEFQLTKKLYDASVAPVLQSIKEQAEEMQGHKEFIVEQYKGVEQDIRMWCRRHEVVDSGTDEEEDTPLTPQQRDKAVALLDSLIRRFDDIQARVRKAHDHLADMADAQQLWDFFAKLPQHAIPGAGPGAKGSELQQRIDLACERMRTRRHMREEAPAGAGQAPATKSSSGGTAMKVCKGTYLGGFGTGVAGWLGIGVGEAAGLTAVAEAGVAVAAVGTGVAILGLAGMLLVSLFSRGKSKSKPKPKAKPKPATPTREVSTDKQFAMMMRLRGFVGEMERKYEARYDALRKEMAGKLDVLQQLHHHRKVFDNVEQNKQTAVEFRQQVLAGGKTRDDVMTELRDMENYFGKCKKELRRLPPLST